MLVLSRKLNQSILIGADVRVVVVGLDGEHVKLGIEAPREVAVRRSEIVGLAGTRDGPPSRLAPVGKKRSEADISRDAVRK